MIETAAYAALLSHHEAVAPLHMRALFRDDPSRAARMTLALGDLRFDFSKHRVTDETITRLLALAEETGVANGIEQMFSGAAINTTEQRAVLHIALRNRKNRAIRVDGHNIMASVAAVLAKMRTFVERLSTQKHTGFTGKPITDIVNIGIGGSDLGPSMLAEALRPYWRKGVRAHFVSNVDGADLATTLEALDAEQTLFIVASKTFRTLETRLNARSARRWLVERLGNEAAVASHFAAVSTNTAAVKEFGIDPANVFEMWDWVGGRYSMWSAIGLAVACTVGMDNFEDLLSGAFEMDEHFRTAPLAENVPVRAALLGIWYANFFHAETFAVLPYDHRLRRLPAWLQQGDMESNGKRTRADGRVIEGTTTGPVVWGEPGTNAQHSFFQLLHQGTRLVPCDFIAALNAHHTLPDHHDQLLANLLAQSEALMTGRTEAEARAELEASGLDAETVARLTPHKVFEGNRPSTVILFDRLDPPTLGKLLAFYEHRIFVQGWIFGVNSFDQWGVELGKVLADRIHEDLVGQPGKAPHDSSTAALIAHVSKGRKHA